jgi:HSP20 family protein
MYRLPQKPIRLRRDLDRRVDEVFVELIHSPWRGPSTAFDWEPAIDVCESPQEYLVLVELPGVMPGEVHVQVDGQTLVIHGTRTSQQWSQAGAMIYSERFHGDFMRRIPLPGAVEGSGLKVTFSQGLVLIRLPKRQAETE